MLIVVDIETSGVDPERCGIWQIGAIDVDDPKNTFLDECRIDDDDLAVADALNVCGKSESYVRDPSKQSQKELLEKFFAWCNNAKMKNFICQNPQFDTVFLMGRAKRYGIKYPFHYRALDLHSIAAAKYYELRGRFLMQYDYSGMNLGAILEFCGIVFPRGYHDALEDAKLTAECFSRIVYGKKLLDMFDLYNVPKYLSDNKNRII